MAHTGGRFLLIQRQFDGDQQRLRPQAFFSRIKLRLAQPALGHRQVEQHQLLATLNQGKARRMDHQHPTKTVLAAVQRHFSLSLYRWEQRLFRRFWRWLHHRSSLHQFAVKLAFALLVAVACLIGRLRCTFARDARFTRLRFAARRRLREMVAAGGDAVFRLPGWRRRLFRLIVQRQRRVADLLQHGSYRLINKVMYQSRLMKTYFVLGRMHIHVYLVRIDLEIKYVRGLLIVFQLILIGLADGMIDQTIAHHAAIDVTILHLAQLTRPGRISHPAANGQVAMLPGNVQGMLQKSRATNAAQAALIVALVFGCAILADQFAVVAEVDRHIETRQRNAPHHFIDMAEFGFLGAHEFAPRRGVVEQIQHFQRAAYRMCRWFDRHRLIAAFGIGLPGFILFRRARSERQTGNRADAGQRLAAKTETDDGFQIVERADFTGGMTRQCQCQIVFTDAAAVIADANQLGTAAFDININACRTGIQTVFHQFLYH
ncbi:hypothetical protein D3C79_476280 [compost metagenome]